MRTGELARRAGMNVETLRFYERQKLLPSPSRTAGGYRHYNERDLETVCFIKQCQHLGFTLKEIGQLEELHRVFPNSAARGETEDCRGGEVSAHVGGPPAHYRAEDPGPADDARGAFAPGQAAAKNPGARLPCPSQMTVVGLRFVPIRAIKTLMRLRIGPLDGRARSSDGQECHRSGLCQ